MSLHQKIIKEPLTEQVVSKIIEIIESKEIGPGDKLPSERVLSEMLGIGRSTLREAIKLLVSRNILEIKRGKGTYVCEKTGIIDDPLGFQFVEDKKKLAIDLSEIRLMIEPKIASNAALNATEKEILELGLLCESLEADIKKGVDYTARDIAFHTAIANCSGNSVVPRLIPVIAQGIQLYVDMTRHQMPGASLLTHRKVFEAIKARDAEGAYEGMKAHLLENNKTLITLKS